MLEERLADYGELTKTLSVLQLFWLGLQAFAACRDSSGQDADYPFSTFGLLTAPGHTHVALCLWPRSGHDGLLPVPGLLPMSQLLLLGSAPLPLSARLVLACSHGLLGRHQRSRPAACVDANEPPNALKVEQGLGFTGGLPLGGQARSDAKEEEGLNDPRDNGPNEADLALALLRRTGPELDVSEGSAGARLITLSAWARGGVEDVEISSSDESSAVWPKPSCEARGIALGMLVQPRSKGCKNTSPQPSKPILATKVRSAGNTLNPYSEVSPRRTTRPFLAAGNRALRSSTPPTQRSRCPCGLQRCTCALSAQKMPRPLQYGPGRR